MLTSSAASRPARAAAGIRHRRLTAPARLAAPRAQVEDQPELADLHLVAVVQRDLVDPLAVDVGAVEAADVADGEAAAGSRRNSACRRDTVTSSRKMSLSGAGRPWSTSASSRNGARVRAALDHEQRRARAAARRRRPGPSPTGPTRRPRRLSTRDRVSADDGRRRGRAGGALAAPGCRAALPCPRQARVIAASSFPWRSPTSAPVTRTTPPCGREPNPRRQVEVPCVPAVDRARQASWSRYWSRGVEQRVDRGRRRRARSRRSSPRRTGRS